MQGELGRSDRGRPAWRSLGTLGMGAAPLGNLYAETSDDQAVAVVQRALATGIRYFDVAPLYGRGLAERRLAAGLALGPADVILSTKVGAVLRPKRSDDPPLSSIYVSAPDLRHDFGYDADAVLQSLSASAERLGRFPDLVLVHDLSPATHGDAYAHHLEQFLTSGLPALLALKQQGRIAAIGAGLMDCAAAMRLIEQAPIDVLLLAGRYTLLDQSALDDVLPLCLARDIPVIAGSPFSSGILATGSSNRLARHEYGPADGVVRTKVAALETCCTRFGIALPTAALQFPLGHPAIITVLPGLASPTEVAVAADAMRVPVPADFWMELRDQGLIRADTPLPRIERIVADA